MNNKALQELISKYSQIISDEGISTHDVAFMIEDIFKAGALAHAEATKLNGHCRHLDCKSIAREKSDAFLASLNDNNKDV